MSDLKTHLMLLGEPEVVKMSDFVRTNLDREEMAFQENEEQKPSMQLIKWRIVDFKLNKLLGSFENIGTDDKLALVNSIVQTYLWSLGFPKKDFTEFDRQNFDDMIIVAAEIIY